MSRNSSSRRGRGRWIAGSVAALVVCGAIGFAMTLSARRNGALMPAASSFYSTEAWLPLGGDWSASDVEIRNRSEERGAKVMTRLGSWADYQVEADVQAAEPFGGAGLVIRSGREEEGVDSFHGYYAGIRRMDGVLEFGRADFGWQPLLLRRLPPDADLSGPLHMRVVAVGCRFGVELTLADLRKFGAVTEDTDCLRAGRFGLRSYLTSATWRNVRVSPATGNDIAEVTQNASGTGQISPDSSINTLDPVLLQRFVAAVLPEARKHETLPGVTPIVDFLFAPGVHPDVNLQGVIISLPPLMAIQDETNALIVPDVDMNSTIKLGDVVEAHGTVISDRFRSRLEKATMRVLWSETPVPPLAVTAAQLTSGTYRGRSIELEGILRSANFNPESYELVLQDGHQEFRVVGARDFLLNPARFQIGSRLRLRGIATSLPSFTKGLYPFALVAWGVEVLSAPPWWSPKHIMWVVAACAGLVLILQLGLHQLQRWHLRSILNEREQLAFEMHDTLAQSFTGIAYQLQAASIESRGEEMKQIHLRNALEMVQLSHREASRTIAALRPQYRDAAEILSALKESAERLSDGGALKLETRLTGRVTNLPLEVTDCLFRIGQEAVSNALQHADCKTLTISLRLALREAELSVRDDGRGFSELEVKGGLGLSGMRKRAAKINARFDLATRPEEGTAVTIKAAIPLVRGRLYSLRAKLKGTQSWKVLG